MATNELTILLKARDEASKVLQGAGKGVGQMKKAVVGAGLAMAAAGVAVDALARKQAPLLEATKKLANQTGMTEKEIRGMATSLSNATFPLEDALGLMELGSQQGLKGAAALKEYANFWDTVGDATGLTSTELAKSAAALKAVGIEAGQETKLLKAFGLVTQKSTGNVGDFLGFVEKLAPEMKALGLSVDEAAVIMTTMENELGLTAKVAKTEFKAAMEAVQSEIKATVTGLRDNTAELEALEASYMALEISQEDYVAESSRLNKGINNQRAALEKLQQGGLNPVREALGITTAQVDKYWMAFDESTEVIQANADAHAATKTPLEQLQSRFADLTFTMGPYIQKAASIAPLLMTIGPALAALSAAKKVYTVVTKAAGLAARAFGFAIRFAMGPVGLIVLAITGLVAAGVLIWKNWDTISAKARAIWGSITAFFERTLSFLVGLFKNHWDKILLIIFPVAGIGVLVWKHWGAIADVAGAIWEKVKRVFTGGFGFVVDILVGVGGAVAGAFKTALNAVISGLNAALNVAARVVLKTKAILDKAPFGNPLGGALQGLAGALEKGVPHLESGVRNFQGGLAVVGERGEELVNLPRGADVFPHGAAPSITVQVFLDNQELSARALTFLGQELINEEQVLGS